MYFFTYRPGFIGRDEQTAHRGLKSTIILWIETGRKGYGTDAFQHLMAALQIETIDLEVMVWNERGLEFLWSLGGLRRGAFT